MYTRPTRTTSSFVRGTFYIIKADLHNRRITTIVGPAGRAGRTTVKNFKTRDEAREYYDMLVERREALQYAQVS